jgi:hypothetical protein
MRALSVSLALTLSCSAFAADGDAKKTLLLAFEKLAAAPSYRMQSKGQSGDTQIDSRIDIHWPDHFHVRNRTAPKSELILTPDGSFMKSGDSEHWLSVPMPVASMAASLDPKVSLQMLAQMRNLKTLGSADCQAGKGKPGQQFQFSVPSSVNPKHDVLTTVTIANQDGLPCVIRAQQAEERLDTIVHYDFAAKFEIKVPEL